jgi:HNH endonuclease
MLTQERLRELLAYDPETGLFTWRSRRKGVQVGEIAGSVERNGYTGIKIDQKHCLAHRLAWLYVYGGMPAGDIDHINRNRADNRIENLRAANRSQNCANARLWKNNTSGLRGVRKFHKKWRATVGYGGRLYHLGTFATAEEASRAYCTVAKACWKDFYSESNNG